jgi:hypothetical protein
MCQLKECVQKLQAANFVSQELKTDAVYWLHTTVRLSAVLIFRVPSAGTEAD